MGSAIRTIQYVYDSRGNRKALIDPDGGRFTYTYDAVNRISQVQNPQGDRTSYSYDPAGRRTLKEMANGTRTSFSYDPAGNLTGLYNLKSGGTVISSFDYAYDNVGNRTSVLEADGSRVTWSYDDTYQLTGEHRTGSSPYRDTYTYDPTGNRLLMIHNGARTTYAYDAANQLVYSQDVSGRTTYTFDADGNQQVVRAPSGDRTTYVWDYENRMTSTQLPTGIRNTMAYDADGLRVKLEESTGTKKFVWDDQNYLAETDAANDTHVVYTNEPRRYGNLISQRRGSDSHWYHFDAIGSTRELTNASAVITDTRLYDAWGNIATSSGSVDLPLAFVGDKGYYCTGDSRLTYVRQRSTSPPQGQWVSRDPVAFRDGPHWYRYCRNTPLNAIDPSGLLTWWCCEIAFGAGGQSVGGVPVDSVVYELYAAPEGSGVDEANGVAVCEYYRNWSYPGATVLGATPATSRSQCGTPPAACEVAVHCWTVRRPRRLGNEGFPLGRHCGFSVKVHGKEYYTFGGPRGDCNEIHYQEFAPTNVTGWREGTFKPFPPSTCQCLIFDYPTVFHCPPCVRYSPTCTNSN